MTRKLNQIRSLRVALGLAVAIGLAAARSEKIWAESLNDLHLGELAITTQSHGQEPFDPARVPQSGGMASRLLAGITARLG